MKIKSWHVVQVVGNRKPLSWQKKGKDDKPLQEVTIDVASEDRSNRAYPVKVFKPNRFFYETVRIIGWGKAYDPKESWQGAYERAREIATRHMKRN